ncbi:MAG: response regulator [Candidatus Magasanikbacteria bacterium]|nr:response regulator [Candidatus Magasanikbacteria bacterium]
MADDTALFRNMLKDYLEILGYTVTPVVDGKKAFEEWKKNPTKYAFILTDNDMPEMTGCELVVALRTNGCTIPIVMASLSTAMAIQVLLSTGKLNGFIAKGTGLSTTTLQALLKKVLGS